MPATSLTRNQCLASRAPSRSGPLESTGSENDGGLDDSDGDWVSPAPSLRRVYSDSDRKQTTPAARMLIATPEIVWSTPKVTVATACSSPPRAPISSPPTIAPAQPHW